MAKITPEGVLDLFGIKYNELINWRSWNIAEGFKSTIVFLGIFLCGRIVVSMYC